MKTSSPAQTQTAPCAKQRLIDALNNREAIVSELVRKGLAQRRGNAVDMNDTRHPRYRAFRDADSEYWCALHAAEEAGVITLHNQTFSWKS